MVIFHRSLVAASLAAILPATVVFAQQAPDAGRTLQQQQQQQLPQAPRPGPALDVQGQAGAPVAPGGAQVTLQSVRVSGQTVFSEAQLLALLGDYAGKAYDLAGLRALAERITAHYRSSGYPFARAIVPQQAMADGALRIEVVEGRYGQVGASGDAAVAGAAAGYLSPLKPGDVIQGPLLERTALILDDLPGVDVSLVIRPGSAVGTGDLDVRIQRTPAFSGEIGLDNQGNRYTGQHRARASLQWDGLFLFGDQLQARAMVTDEALWMGNLGYSLRLGTTGLRANVGVAHTRYELGQDFAALGATGTAKVTSAGVTYPVVRTQQANLAFAMTYQHKKLNDRNTLGGTDNDKSSDSVALALNFDRRDAWGGGGVTYGAWGVSSGRLQLDAVLAAQDAASGANTRGNFMRWNLDLARSQATPIPGLSLFGRLSTQWSQGNLDSSEGFTVGGPQGVRAYPSGEGNGDEGWLAQLEVRYAMGAVSPYLFHDAGRVRVNADPGSLVVAPATNHRAIAGSGVGVRYQQGAWSLDAAVAWRSQGGPQQSDTRQRNPRLWVNASFKF